MAVFPEDAIETCRAGINIRNEVALRQVKATKFGDFNISVKIGISYGLVEWGITGLREKKTYYFKGEAVNSCSEAEKNCSPMDIVIDEAAFEQIEKISRTSKIASGFRILSDISSGDINHDKINKSEKCHKSIRSFIPQIILDSKPVDELRDAVSIFICIKEKEWKYDNLNRFSADMLELAQKWGGYFSRISFGDKGCSALINFGIPVMHENNMERALEFILEVSTIYGNDIKAGITFGRLFAGYIGSGQRSAYDVLGDSVNLSARIAVESDWGDLRMPRDTAELSRGSFNVRYVGQFKFKGKKRKIYVYKLEGKRALQELSFKGPFFGRDREIKTLNRYIRPVFNNRFGGIVYIYGEPGMGKSRLVYESMLSVSHSKENCILQCDCILRKPWSPFKYFFYYYFRQEHNNSEKDNKAEFKRRFVMLSGSLDKTGNDRAKEIKAELSKRESALMALLSLDTQDTFYARLDAEQQHNNTVYAIKDFFKALSLIKPLIIQVEDIHCIDHDSAETLRHLTINMESYPLVIVCSGRYNDDGSRPEIVCEKNTRTNIIDLCGLDNEASVKMAEKILGNPPGKTLTDIILERAGNNPFYLEQLCLFMRENNYIELKEGLYRLSRETDDVPSGISEILITRIDRLSQELRELTKIASVFGQEFEHKLLFKTIGILSDMIKLYERVEQKGFDCEAIYKIMGLDKRKLLKEGENKSLWDDIDEVKYLFRHSLLCESAYSMQLEYRLRILHRTVAEAIEHIYKAREDYFIDLAHHYERAGIRDKARDYLQKAGNYLQKTYKNHDAIIIYKRLLEYLEDPAEIIDVKIKIGTIMELTGRWTESEMIFKECIIESETINNGPLLLESYKSMSDLLRNMYRLEEAKKYIKSFYDIAQKSNNLEETGTAYGYWATVYGMSGEFKKSLSYLKKYRQIAEETGDKRGVATATGNMGIVYMNTAQYEKALDCHKVNRKIKENLGDMRGVAISLGNMGNTYYYKGDFNKALEHYEQNRQILEKIGDKRGMGKASGNMAFAYLQQGKYKEALKHIRKDKAISEELGDRYGIAHAMGLIGDIFRKTGDNKKALSSYEDAIKIFYEIRVKKSYFLKCLSAKVDILLEKGDFAGAGLTNNELYRTAKDGGYAEYILYSRLNRCKINGMKNMEKTARCIRRLITDEIPEDVKAMLFYELYALEKSRESKIACLKYYRNLYRIFPKHEYLQRIKELEGK